MNISKELLHEIEINNLYISFCDYDTMDDRPIEEANAINIGSYDLDHINIPIGTFIRTPKKKEVTFEWIMNKINKESTFVNLTEIIQKHLNLSGISVYAASYGIGMFRLFGIEKETLDKVNKFLIDNNIEYRNEFSVANWVYRYVISKKTENIEKLKKITL